MNNENVYEQNWYFIDFREDWIETIRTYKRLPFNNTEEPLKLVEENMQLKNKNKKLEAENQSLIAQLEAMKR